MVIYFLVTSFARYKEFTIGLIHLVSFQMYNVFFLVQVVLIFGAFVLGLNILKFEWSETLAARATQPNILEIPFP